MFLYSLCVIVYVRLLLRLRSVSLCLALNSVRIFCTITSVEFVCGSKLLSPSYLITLYFVSSVVYIKNKKNKIRKINCLFYKNKQLQYVYDTRYVHERSKKEDDTYTPKITHRLHRIIFKINNRFTCKRISLCLCIFVFFVCSFTHPLVHVQHERCVRAKPGRLQEFVTFYEPQLYGVDNHVHVSVSGVSLNNTKTHVTRSNKMYIVYGGCGKITSII